MSTISRQADGTTQPFWTITQRLRRWAALRGIEVDDRGWVTNFDDNFFRPMSDATRNDLIRSGELSAIPHQSRITALHSSSALAINIFDPWRGADASALMRGLGLAAGLRVIGLEQKHPTGLRGTPPHLDAVLRGGGLRPVGIEVKLREPYGPVINSFADAYFTRPGLWDRHAQLKQLAVQIAAMEAVFERLHAGQLIKHALGLARSYGAGAFTLLYLWHDEPSPEAKTHREEIARFAAVVDRCLDFRVITLGELLGAVEGAAAEWVDYVAGRYLPGEGIEERQG